jgi:oxidase EvaA
MTGSSARSLRIGRSARTREGAALSMADFYRWFADRLTADPTTVVRIDFADLVGWHFAESSGNLVHDSGRFFSVEGLRVEAAHGPVPGWTQPIVKQPETGVLGILVKEFDGILHCLMQAKMEPGNHNRLQLSPTVQATRSNYTAVHGGRSVPYLQYFQDIPPERALVDVIQSEHGSWFYQKRNRNLVVETTGEVELRDDFCWLSLGQVHRLLGVDDLVNMDSRTVLSCLPFADCEQAGDVPGDSFRAALRRSLTRTSPARHSDDEILGWLTELRSRREIVSTPIPLRDVLDWQQYPDRISNDRGAFFDVRAVAVHGAPREIGSWTQPIIAPRGHGVVAFLATRLAGILHVLVQARAEPGCLDFADLAPTVQCIPDSYRQLNAEALPPLLSAVLGAPAEAIRFDTVLAEEGGRLFHARSRYLVVEVDPATTAAVTEPHDGPPRYRWMTVGQLAGLLRHSNYVNVQARTLIACLHGMATDDLGDW